MADSALIIALRKKRASKDMKPEMKSSEYESPDEGASNNKNHDSMMMDMDARICAIEEKLGIKNNKEE